MAVKKKKSTWVKPRHKLITDVLRFIFRRPLLWRYNIEIPYFRENPSRPVLILINHQTGFDQFFVYAAFRAPIYFIASEDIFSLGLASKAISWLVNPIPIKKQTSDLRAVRTALQVAKEGGSIALAPEGNRTYSGELCYINPAILGLIRLTKLPVVCFRIEGGFGKHPRWSDVLRKGSMKAYVSRIIEPEECKALSDEELMEQILEGINVNEACITSEYHSDKSAEYMERAVYICPECGLSRFESHGQELTCTQCGLKVRYLASKEFELLTPEKNFPFRFLADWYRWQEDFVRNMDLTPYYDIPIYEDNARFSEVILYDKKRVISKNMHITLCGNRVILRSEDGAFDENWHFDDIDAITVLGKNKANIYREGRVYQIKPDKRFNALRYVNIFNHYKAVMKGENNGKQFLGL